MDRKLCRCRPCFYQVDLLLRSLLSDEEVGYVPRFTILLSTQNDVKARTLFTEPAFVPPPALVSSFPTGCGNANCDEQGKDCGMIDFKKFWALKKDSRLVRRDKFPRAGGVKCNLWICKVEEEPGYTGPSKFQKCQKCKEALYCSREHQVCISILSFSLVTHVPCSFAIGIRISEYVKLKPSESFQKSTSLFLSCIDIAVSTIFLKNCSRQTLPSS